MIYVQTPSTESDMLYTKLAEKLESTAIRCKSSQILPTNRFSCHISFKMVLWAYHSRLSSLGSNITTGHPLFRSGGERGGSGHRTCEAQPRLQTPSKSHLGRGFSFKLWMMWRFGKRPPRPQSLHPQCSARTLCKDSTSLLQPQNHFRSRHNYRRLCLWSEQSSSPLWSLLSLLLHFFSDPHHKASASGGECQFERICLFCPTEIWWTSFQWVGLLRMR